MRGMNDIGLDRQISVDKIGRNGFVSANPADGSGGHNDRLGSSVLQPALDRGVIAQIDRFAIGRDTIGNGFAAVLTGATRLDPSAASAIKTYYGAKCPIFDRLVTLDEAILYSQDETGLCELG
jgi:hypothetical protein